MRGALWLTAVNAAGSHSQKQRERPHAQRRPLMPPVWVVPLVHLPSVVIMRYSSRAIDLGVF